MPRAATKQVLLAEIKQERQTLEEFLATLTPLQMELPRVVGDWSVKDVLAHLIEWEQMVLGWYAAGGRGEVPPTPAEGFKWSQLPALNQCIFEKHQHRTLDSIEDQFQTSYQEILNLVETVPDEILTTPGYHEWMRDNTLLAYINSATAAHYRWARKEIRQGLKMLAQISY